MIISEVNTIILKNILQMNKRIFLAISIFIGLIMTACGGSQKPSERTNVWDDAEKDEVELSTEKVCVPFKRTAGDLAEVQVSLNGVPFNMWWDTGASMTCISALELQKLVKEGKIELDDYQGSILTKIADGSTTEALVFNIKEIYIPGTDNQYLVLRDIDAAVSASANAPLLIGQNVIQNLPKHSFDETKGLIIFDK